MGGISQMQSMQWMDIVQAGKADWEHQTISGDIWRVWERSWKSKSQRKFLGMPRKGELSQMHSTWSSIWSEIERKVGQTERNQTLDIRFWSTVSGLWDLRTSYGSLIPQLSARIQNLWIFEPLSTYTESLKFEPLSTYTVSLLSEAISVSMMSLSLKLLKHVYMIAEL